MEVENFRKILQDHLEDKGLEVYPFKIGWYNDRVIENYRLPYTYDTLAFIIISKPDMFEKAFIPFVRRQDNIKDGQDLIDQCQIEIFQSIKQKFPEYTLEIIHDFELHHSRRPKILVQTAGHVAGAAYYYQQSDLKDDPTALPATNQRKLFGVSLHPKYGGWFALRGCVIFPEVECDLERNEPLEMLQTDEHKRDLLEKFNYQWQDWAYRDVIPVTEKYSPQQMKYFETLPKDRKELIDQIRQYGNIQLDQSKSHE